MEHFSYNLGAHTRYAAVSIATEGEYFNKWQQLSAPSWKRWAERHDVALVVFHGRLSEGAEAKAKSPQWDKLLAPKVVQSLYPQIEAVCLLDYDILIGPFAPNVFDFRTPSTYSVVSQEKNLPFPLSDVRKRIAFFRHMFYDNHFPLDSLLLASPQQVFESQGLSPYADYFCAGFIMLDRTLFQDLADCHQSVSQQTAKSAIQGEEPFVNHWVQSRAHSWLPYEFQSIWIFEMAWHYAHLYKHGKRVAAMQETANSIASLLWARHFVHFAGSWHESEAWRASNMNNEVFGLALEESWETMAAMKFTAKQIGKISPS